MSLAKSWDALRLTVTCQRSEKPELARRLLAALLVSWAGDGGLDGLDVRANEDALRSGFASADTDLLGMQSGGQQSTSPAGTGKDLFLSCRGMASASTASPGIPLSVNRPTKLMSTYPSVALGVGGQMRRCPGHRAEPFPSLEQPSSEAHQSSLQYDQLGIVQGSAAMRKQGDRSKG
jgi:hypothetical protein